MFETVSKTAEDSFEETHNQSVRYPKFTIRSPQPKTAITKDSSLFAYILRDRLARARDLDELALCITKLEAFRDQIDRLLKDSGCQQLLQDLIDERRAILTDPANAQPQTDITG
jgi:hypothetical protein